MNLKVPPGVSASKKPSLLRKIKIPKIYFGWWMLIVMSIVSGFDVGFMDQSQSVLFKSISADLNLNRADTSMGTAIYMLFNSLMFPVTALISTRIGPKKPAIIGSCLMGIGLILMNFVHSAWNYYATWGVIVAMGHTLGYTIAIDKMMADWFVRKRGLIFGIRFGLMSAFSVVTVPVITWLLTMYNWRTINLIWAGITFACLPLTFYFVREKRPEYYGLLPDGAKPEEGKTAENIVAQGQAYAAGVHENEFTFRQVMKTSAFWLITVAWIFRGALNGFRVHNIPMLTDRGISPMAAASIMSIMAFCSIPAGIVSGIIADKVGKERLKWLMVALFAFISIGLVLFVTNPTIIAIYLMYILWGVGNGAYNAVDIAIRARFFGRKAYGLVQGTSCLFSSPVGFFMPIYIGSVYDATGSYMNALAILAGIAIAGVIIMIVLRTPKLPSAKTETKPVVSTTD